MAIENSVRLRRQAAKGVMGSKPTQFYPQICRIREADSTMDEAQIYARLTVIFHDVFDDDAIELTSQVSARDIDDWDSLTHIRLIVTIERQFKVKFSTAEIATLQNVGDLVALLRAKA